MGICWSELHDDKKAAEYFSKVLAQKPDSPAANYYLGVQHFDARQYREAAHCFQAAAADEKWDRKAEPYRLKLKEIVLKAATEATTQTLKVRR
jgi:cytochrome c-type biogenesis protein CcmH/NrfG